MIVVLLFKIFTFCFIFACAGLRCCGDSSPVALGRAGLQVRGAGPPGGGRPAGHRGCRLPGSGRCGSWALWHRPGGCGAWAQSLCSTGNPPGSRVEPASPAPAGGFLTLGPLGKPCYSTIIRWSNWVCRCTCVQACLGMCVHTHIYEQFRDSWYRFFLKVEKVKMFRERGEKSTQVWLQRKASVGRVRREVRRGDRPCSRPSFAQSSH